MKRLSRIKKILSIIWWYFVELEDFFVDFNELFLLNDKIRALNVMYLITIVGSSYSCIDSCDCGELFYNSWTPR